MRLLIFLLVMLAMIVFTVAVSAQSQVRWTSSMYTPLITGSDTVVNDSGTDQLHALEAKAGYRYVIQEVRIATSPVDIPATSFASQSGVIVSSNTIGGVDKNDWIRYTTNLSGRTSIDYEYAMSDTQNGSVEFRIGSTTATPVAKMVLPPTGGWANFVTISIPITGKVSEGDLYVTFSESSRTTGSGGNIRKIVLK